jgi:hypothetical protein
MSTLTLQARVNAVVLKRLGEDILLDNYLTVRADFVAPYAQPVMDGVSAEALAPQLVLSSADVPAAVRGMAVVAREQKYTVVNHKPDGYGLSTLYLEQAP